MTDELPAGREKVVKARRSNEDRTAETRARLIEATIECLNRVGYAGTTIGLLSEASGVTRGGLLHHFPSKVDLLIATAEHCLDATRSKTVVDDADQVDRPALMRAMRGPAGIALMEIMLGSRSDPELRARFKVVGERILTLQRRQAEALAVRAGISAADEMQALV